MDTATATAPEPPCGHLHRTAVTGKPDRQVCDDCEQIFQNGFPVTVVREGVSGKPAEKIGQQLSDLTAEAEVPPVTKAAATRAKKARKPKVGKAEGAKTINLNPDELARGKKSDEEDARQKYLKSVSADASFVVGTLKGFAALCKTADEVIEARDEYFSRKFKNPDFAKRVQNIRDFASTKRNNEVLTIDGREYTSVKAFFKAELGVTYEYIRQLCEKGKLGACNLLLEEGSPQTNQPRSAAQPTTVNPTGTPSETGINVPEDEDVAFIPDGGTQQPEAQTVPEVNLSFSLAERVQSAFGFAASCTNHLSLSEKDEFYSKLIDRLQGELQPVIDQTGFMVHGKA
jgi:hypothetical protein